VVDYSEEANQYLVKWINYPHTANEWLTPESDFYESIGTYWKQWISNHPQTPLPTNARNVILELQNTSKNPFIVDTEKLNWATYKKKGKKNEKEKSNGQSTEPGNTHTPTLNKVNYCKDINSKERMEKNLMASFQYC